MRTHKEKSHMKYTKHVGKHGNRKLAIVFREVPGEPHMALVVYTDLLNQNIHDPLMHCLESDIGQQSESLADALNRSYTRDGHVILQKLHAEGLLKKVNTEQIVVLHGPNAQCKLSELNEILNKMNQGKAALQQLDELTTNAQANDAVTIANEVYQEKTVDALSGEMKKTAESLTLEASALLRKAEELLAESRRIETVKKVEVTSSTVRKPGRPKTVKTTL